MTGHRTWPTILEAAGSLAGLLIGVYCAIVLTRHLTLREDPMGLLGTWACVLAMGSLLGGILGQLVAQSLGGRGTPGRPRPSRVV
jgi:hypothetical protein